MSDSRQLDVLKRLTAHLQGITTDNGYEFDLSTSVFRGRREFGDNDPDTLVSIVESLQGEVNVDSVGSDQVNRRETWVLFVQGWVKHNGRNPTDGVYQLKASVEKRLSECILKNDRGDPAYPDAYLLGVPGTVTGMIIGPGIVSAGIPPQHPSSRAFFYLPIGIDLALDISDPFLPD